MNQNTFTILWGIVIQICWLLPSIAEEPWFQAEVIFPGEDIHNHGSCIVECPNGDLLVCWFHGGERQSDNAYIEGARWVKRKEEWTERFLMADTPGFPDTNCCMIIDPEARLWLLWPTIQANTWESALMKYKVSTNYMHAEGPPKWDYMKVLHMKPGDDFEQKVKTKSEEYLKSLNITANDRMQRWINRNCEQAADKLTRRLGWFTRGHPFILNEEIMLVGLYSDGFSFSLVALTDDWGETWRFSDPIVGGGNIQPTFVKKKDGTLVTYMRDNGPRPKRVHVSESKDNGLHWSTVYDHPILPNPGAGLEVANLNDGDWIIIYNDTEQGRHSLAVSITQDEGKTLKWTRHLEYKEPGQGGSFSYPSIIQTRDGLLHSSYTYNNKGQPDPRENGKTIKHAAFNKAWVMTGDPAN